MIAIKYLMLALVALVRPAPMPATEPVFDLTVEVNNLRSSQGVAQFALYNTEGTIPDQHYTKYFRMLRAEIKDRHARVTFADLPSGHYAVNVLHDENGNNKLDRGIMLPREGIGFSNMTRIGPANKPSFEKARFELQRDESIEVSVIYL